MSSVLIGRTWVFGNQLDVDWQICNLHQLQAQAEAGAAPSEDELGSQCLIGLDPEFPTKVLPGDIIIAGEGTGYSSACLDGFPDDPHRFAFATLALRGAGISAVVCESVVATFERNCLDHGLPVVECPGITRMVTEGDTVKIDLKAGLVTNLTTNAHAEFKPLPDFLLRMIDAGGLYPLLEQQADQ